MKNSVSNHSFEFETDDDNDGGGDVEKAYEHGSDSESYNSSNENDDESGQQRKGSILIPAWPQSFMQSIDLYGSLPSSSLGFQGASSLSQLGSSFLTASFLKRRTAEILPSLSKPLIPEVDEEKLPTSEYLQKRPVSRKSSSVKSVHDKKQSYVHELPGPRRSSYGQAVLNGMNVLCGVGLLSTPYAVKEGGWIGISILLVFAILSFYTGILLRYCLDSQPGLQTYPDIGQAAFGTTGRVIISIILYVELYACSIEYLILESDNLSSLFPNAHLNLGLFELNSHNLFALVITLAVLPTVWLRDMSILSYISAGGVLATVLVIACLFWVGLLDHVNVHAKDADLNLSTLPVAIGLYGFCYSGHAVFPNIYSSMEKPNQYSSVILTSFGICTLMYAGVAVMGYTMFGQSTQSQFTLNMPKDLVASKIAVWTTVVNPFTKYALTLSPVAMSLEELIPSTTTKFCTYSILIRTALVISTLLVGLTIPYFGLVMALIGSLLTMLVTLILPCACYMSILRGKLPIYQILMCVFVIGVGVMSSALGTYSAISKIVEKLS